MMFSPLWKDAIFQKVFFASVNWGATVRNDLQSVKARIRFSFLKVIEENLEAIERRARSGLPPIDVVAAAIAAQVPPGREAQFTAVEDSLAEWLVLQGLVPVAESRNGGPWRRDVFHPLGAYVELRLPEAQALAEHGLDPHVLFENPTQSSDGQWGAGVNDVITTKIDEALAATGLVVGDFTRNAIALVKARTRIAEEKPPIGAFAELIASRPEQWQPCWRTAIERALDTILTQERYVPYPGGWGRATATDDNGNYARRYFRPSHAPLLNRIDAGEQVIIVSTREARRIAREVIDSLNSRAETRPVYIWSVGSGLFNVFNNDGNLAFREVTDADPELSLRFHFQTDARLDPEANDRAREEARVELRAADFMCIEPHETPAEIEAWWAIRKFDESKFEILAVTCAELDDITRHMLSIELLSRARPSFEQIQGNRMRLAGTGREAIAPEALARLLTSICANKDRDAVYILHDVQRYLDEARSGIVAGITISAVRDAAVRLRRGNTRTQIVLLASELPSAAELEEVAQVDIGLPSRAELAYLLAQRLQQSLSEDREGDMLLRLVDSAAGMTLSQVLNAVRPLTRSKVQLPVILEEIARAKKVALKRSGALELVLNAATVALGGMDRFQQWLGQRRKVFEHPAAAATAGISRSPRGVLLVGIPGTGKSLAAREVARQWQLPLLRLDLGSVQNKFIGESERNMRDALRVVSAMSPCVLWIDEIEKGISDDTYENRSSMNTRATLLTWLQESTSPAFVVATANRMGRLPPELTRAGRFDAQFFFGCPTEAGLAEILDLHLSARRVSIGESYQGLIPRMIGFTGAEIEQVVLNACYRAFAESRAVTIADLELAIGDVKPIVASFGKELEEVWGLIEQGRVLPASSTMLERTAILKLTNPDLFSPMYCRKESIHGWEKFATRAERKLMELPIPGRTAVIMGTGDSEWMYLQTNFPFAREDTYNWKFLDRRATVALNGALDMLVAQFGIDTFLFDTVETWQSFVDDKRFGAYRELFAKPGPGWFADAGATLEESWT